MYKASRILIKARHEYSVYVLEVVPIKKIGGGKVNNCFGNSHEALTKYAGAKITSGWLVNKFNPIRNETEITQHFWNVDANGCYFDTTPEITDDFEYVHDCEIVEYGQVNIDNLNDCVGSSLLLKDGRFIAVDKTPIGLVFNPIDSLKTSNLFLYVTK